MIGARAIRAGGLAAVLVLALAGNFVALGQETILVDFGSSARYLPVASDPGLGQSWVAPAFDDAAWPSGPYGIGYEDGANGAQNLLQTVTPSDQRAIYTRTTFEIADIATIQNLFVGLDYDDAAAVWLNGVEIWRSPELPPGPRTGIRSSSASTSRATARSRSSSCSTSATRRYRCCRPGRTCSPSACGTWV